MSAPYADLIDIIRTEMGLEEDQVMLSNQRIDISKRPGLYIFLQSISPKILATKVWLDEPSEEVQEASMNDLIQIDVMSANMEAVTRRQEIIMALRSIYSEQKQDEGRFQIARIPQDFNNASNLEGGSVLNRFVATIAVAWLDTKRKSTDQFYDQIPTPEVTPNV